MTQFEAIRKEIVAAIEADGLRPGSLIDRCDDIMDRARINADDTVYVEKSAPADQWSDIATATLEGILSSRDAADDERAWFTARGIRF